MNEPAPLSAATASVRTVAADTVFAMLSEPSRRRIPVGLFDGQWHAARSLGGSLPKTFDLIRKHLDALVKAGLVEAQFESGGQKAAGLSTRRDCEGGDDAAGADAGFRLLRRAVLRGAKPRRIEAGATMRLC